MDSRVLDPVPVLADLSTSSSNDSIGTSGLPRGRRTKLHLWLLLPALVCYLALAFTMARVKAPTVDEGWLSSAPANWAQTGNMGTPSLEPTGTVLQADLKGIHQYTYWIMPVSLVFQGVWYKVFGVSILVGRSLSILFGLLALISWFVLITKLSGIPLIGSIAVALLAVDYTFLWSAADARMDMMCVALGTAGLAAFLSLRERNWKAALWVANSLIALSVFTHPNGVLFLLALFLLLVYYDRRRAGWRDLVTLVPYAVLAVLWATYALQRPDYFVAQFGANVSSNDGGRWAGIIHPFRTLLYELVVRYLSHYGVAPYWGGSVPRYAMAIPFIYFLAVSAGWLYRPIRHSRDLRILLFLPLLFFVFLTFLSLKVPNYLVLVLPLYTAALAALLYVSHVRRSTLAPLSLALTAILVACQLGTIAFKVRTDTYSQEYLPTLNFIQSRLAASGGTVLADSYFGFDLGFDHVKDDARLGYYSGVHSDLIVTDSWYNLWWSSFFSTKQPEVAHYVANLLKSQYRIVYAKGPYRVYERLR